MGCEEIRDLLALYAGGETYDHERTAIEAHVASCASCARELDLYREARAGLASLRDESAPAGTWKAVWAGVRGDLFPRKASRSLAMVDSLLRYAAVTMVGIALGVALYWAQRGAAPEAADATVRLMSTDSEAAFATPATSHRDLLRPRLGPPRVLSEGTFYLPRVESIPAGGEKDY